MKFKIAIFSILAATKAYAGSYQITCFLKDDLGHVKAVIPDQNGFNGLKEGNAKITVQDKEYKVYVGFFPPSADEASSYFQMQLNADKHVVNNLKLEKISKTIHTLKAGDVEFSCDGVEN